VTFDDSLTTDSGPRHDRWRIVTELLMLVLLVLVSHFTRLDHVPIMGEEGRHARSAINMIESGDWIVVRNQGVVFPDRPPMTNWLMAVAGLGRGGVDIHAIRLPSAFAILLTALLLYGYCRRLGSGFEALAAPAIFVTLGQVLQLGRLGESEAVFLMFISASLLVWHLGFALGWSPTVTWSAGYALSALGALTKGLQAPIYFVGATAVFLLWRRDWRWLFGRGQWIGLGVFFAVVLSWQIPYYLATDWPSVAGTWFAIVGPRLVPDSLASHLVTFPLEILGSLLPWSPVLLLLGSRAVRRGLWASDLPRRSSRATFLLVSLAVTFPTVWLSAGARSRYYMPLYPLIAVLIAMILTHCAAAARSTPGGRIWRRFLNGTVFAVVFMLAIVAISLFLAETPVASLRPPAAWASMIVLSGLAAVGAALFSRSTPGSRPAAVAIVLTAMFLGLLHSGSVLTQLAARRQDTGPAVAELRSKVPRPEALVSFGPIHSRFRYFWGDLIPEIAWPRTLDALPPEVDYFSFDLRPSETPGARIVTRGMVVWTTPTTLPFEWRRIGAVDCGRKPMNPPDAEVVVGQVIRDADGKPVPARP
jgi:4-amino-4-deoxy-L-arabinose transferase-like glycosyltransferase